MKKLLALALVLVLALSLTAVSLADEVVVAKIGDTEYTALADAFSAAQDGDTIVLQHNAEITGYVGTPANASVTLDLNGFAITGGALDVYGGLTVTGEGSITAGAKHAIWVNGAGAELTVESGTITGGTGYAIVANNDDSTAKINIEGGLIQSGTEGVGALGLFTCQATISGGTILSEVDNTDAIELSNDSTLTVSPLAPPSSPSPGAPSPPLTMRAMPSPPTATPVRAPPLPFPAAPSAAPSWASMPPPASGPSPAAPLRALPACTSSPTACISPAMPPSWATVRPVTTITTATAPITPATPW